MATRYTDVPPPEGRKYPHRAGGGPKLSPQTAVLSSDLQQIAGVLKSTLVLLEDLFPERDLSRFLTPLHEQLDDLINR